MSLPGVLIALLASGATPSAQPATPLMLDAAAIVQPNGGADTGFMLVAEKKSTKKAHKAAKKGHKGGKKSKKSTE